MTPQCLNNVFLLYIHKQEADSLDLISIAKEFVSHTLDVKVVLEIFNNCNHTFLSSIVCLLCKKKSFRFGYFKINFFSSGKWGMLDN